ncbi:hypothetical protein [Cryobacterium tepidiphilum]|nr:hypothetical protein [Cryobacterium tepidiphilum]
MMPVERAVQPLRSKTTWITPITKGTDVTTRIEYQAAGLTCGSAVATIAPIRPIDVVRHRSATVPMPSCPSAVAATTRA